ncbi:hypothetical protein KR067_007717 [Drosophila pandora]|nr:hypothetical protein KR067_007717 [Drosophila pandora]
MTSAEQMISTELEAATLLSVTEENGVVTTIYVAPCSASGEELVEPPPEFLPEDNQLMYHCPYCASAIRTARAFKAHLEACRENCKNKEEDAQQKKQDGAIYQCIMCDQSYTSMRHLHCHIMMHGSSLKNLRCGSCSVKFESEQEYQAHLQSHLGSGPGDRKMESSVTKSFDCIFCRKDFEATFRLGQVSRRYACDDCGKNLKAKQADGRQSLPVKRKLDWTCNRCGRMYKLEGFLLRHMEQCQGGKTKKSRQFEVHEF